MNPVAALQLAEARTRLTVADCCLLTQRSDTYIRGEIKAGRLPAKRIGKQLMIYRRDLDAWTDSQPSAAA